MNTEFSDVREWLHLRREDEPSDEYLEEFLEEFHRRRREDLLKRSARSLFFERVSVWMKEMGAAKWAYGAGLAYGVLMAGLVVWSRGGSGEELRLPGDRGLEGAGHEEVLHFAPQIDEEPPSEPTEF